MCADQYGRLPRGLLLAGILAFSGCSGIAGQHTQEAVADSVTPQAAVGCDSDSENFSEFIKPGWDQLTSYPNNTQLMIIASDPQGFRYMSQRKPYGEEVNKNGWVGAIAPTLQAIRAERQAVNYYVPLVINGDMTEFGHGEERRDTRYVFKSNLPGGAGGPLMLPGLGNHDYSNNVGDCGNNGCARDATCDHITWVQAINPKNNFDYEFVSGNRHRGSLSYSVTVGRVHIIQLNLEPTYTRSFETGGGLTGKPKRYFDITGARNWLEADLRAAHVRGEHIIINLHKRGTSSDPWNSHAEHDGWFKDLVNQYGVAAIFTGHYHNQIGLYERLGNVPVFQDGALLAKSYLRLKFDWSYMKLYVEPVMLDQGAQAPIVVDLPYKGPEDEISLTFYEHENYQGASCSIGVKPRATGYFRLCGDFSARASSVRVENFSPGDELCLIGSGNKRQCFTGNYRGTFPLANLSGNYALPSGLRVTVEGGSMNDDVQSVKRLPEFSVYDIGITLYQQAGMQGASCAFRVSYGKPVEVDMQCGSEWVKKAASAKISGLQPEGTVLFLGGLENLRSYQSLTYTGDIDVPTLSGSYAPIEGVNIYQKGDLSGKLAFVSFSRPDSGRSSPKSGR